ncbi:LLM class F420-dependent oxidoreductase [Mycolicibacterium duvalii]|uniref:LLM class F420-dependent oxidoreductase n=1 Tax=Mycolicibacterium duvalii TaxID=39688 RepID=A0A7I7K220_9MYCO|nr:TIGR03619 family F420-dependent LLM class oxidoreductase [Mycolicibacterium duvalii]MCV7370465.1 TIGR03619 family F420-dependent LLM class oxidoreductase [Mycolicibacterium duvalii]PEG37391.1 LLM class F420-dependent oxidoreductase [Mycolicibacterium duvalii]BBX17628.1 LLM class F420-dependent oxidoreductase [Mycolicibacterium duvalii]
MRYTLEYPGDLPAASADFGRPGVIADVVTAAEAAGFDAVALSDHPAPSMKWRAHGGHDTLDPVAALSFMAAVTTRISLMTNLFVLPYRNPYLAAKALTTLDRLSGGRLIAGLGAGYLRSEFAALGVEFSDRAALFDEALAALWSIWVDPDTPVRGRGFATVGPVWLQRPAQRPHPPIWIGGNGAAAQRRVVEYGTGWMPIIAPEVLAATMRTTAIPDVDAFSRSVTRLRDRMAAAGRDPRTLDVQVICPAVDVGDAAGTARTLETLEALAAAGATWALIRADGRSPRAAREFIDAFGSAVIRRRTLAATSPAPPALSKEMS